MQQVKKTRLSKSAPLWATSLLMLWSSFGSAQKADTLGLRNINPVSQKKTYYIEAGSYGTKRESDPPKYVRSLETLGKGFEKMKWLDVGLDFRARGEYRKNDIRRPQSFSEDLPLLLRERIYVGIKNIIDPFRLVLEVEDAHRNNGKYPLDNRDVNRYALIQAYGELNFKNALGKDELGNSRPILLRGGRMCFEFLDRRLIGLNEWRNTTNNFLGLRASIGQDKNDWQVDLLALQPITRLLDKIDTANTDQLFYGAIGHWRKWSDVVTIEPYYLALKQNPTTANSNRFREIHGMGLRLYGWFLNESVNYDFTGMYQTGADNGLKQDAYAVTAEIGYSIKSHKWKPRISGFYGIVSGDKNPTDKVSNRFERYFGFARPWCPDDYIVMENVVTPKIKFEFEPIKGYKIDCGYGYYWLESSTDRFFNLLEGKNNRDTKGLSGKMIGHGSDFRLRFSPTEFLNLNLGYMHFTTGDFVRNRQIVANKESSPNSDFAYIELSFNVFDMVKSINTPKKVNQQ